MFYCQRKQNLNSILACGKTKQIYKINFDLQHTHARTHTRTRARLQATKVLYIAGSCDNVVRSGRVASVGYSLSRRSDRIPIVLT